MKVLRREKNSAPSSRVEIGRNSTAIWCSQPSTARANSRWWVTAAVRWGLSQVAKDREIGLDPGERVGTEAVGESARYHAPAGCTYWRTPPARKKARMAMRNSRSGGVWA